jgi:hypothetical protein
MKGQSRLPRPVAASVRLMNKRLADPATSPEDCAKILNALAKLVMAGNRAPKPVPVKPPEQLSRFHPNAKL